MLSRKPSAVLGLAVLAVTFAVVPAASAHPLDGRDPVQAGCASDAYTVTSAPIYRNRSTVLIGRVYLRYSPRCGTNWAKVERFDGFSRETMTARIVRPSDNYFNNYVGRGSSIYGDMAYAPNTCTYAYGGIDESYTSGAAQTGCF